MEQISNEDEIDENIGFLDFDEKILEMYDSLQILSTTDLKFKNEQDLYSPFIKYLNENRCLNEIEIIDHSSTLAYDNELEENISPKTEVLKATKEKYLETIKILQKVKLEKDNLKKKLLELGENSIDLEISDEENVKTCRDFNDELSEIQIESHSIVDIKNNLKMEFNEIDNEHSFPYTIDNELSENILINDDETDNSNEEIINEINESFSSDNDDFDAEKNLMENTNNSVNEEAPNFLHIDIIEDRTCLVNSETDFDDNIECEELVDDLILEEWIEEEQFEYQEDVLNQKLNIQGEKNAYLDAIEIKIPNENEYEEIFVSKKNYNEKFISFLNRNKRRSKSKIVEKSSKESQLNTATSNLIKCEICKEIFSNKILLKRHLKTHAQLIQCSYCERKCYDRTALIIHERRHRNDRRFECEYCHEKFFTLYEKNRHELIWHYPESNNNDIDLNIKPHRRKILTYDQKKKFSPKSLLGEDGRYHCKMCDKVCLTAKTMRKHTTMHLNGKKCPICYKTFAYESALRRHLKVPHAEKNFMCTVCGNRYTIEVSLKAHLKVHSENALKCPICLKDFGSMYYFDRHMKRKHKMKDWLDVYPDMVKRIQNKN